MRKDARKKQELLVSSWINDKDLSLRVFDILAMNKQGNPKKDVSSRKRSLSKTKRYGAFHGNQITDSNHNHRTVNHKSLSPNADISIKNETFSIA